MSIKELTEVCNKLVGSWYCEQIDEKFTFHLNTELFQTEGKVTVVNKKGDYKPFDLLYGVGTFITPTLTEKTYYYIDLNLFNKRYYKIESITSDLLVLREYWMEPNRPEAEYVLLYKRVKPDISTAEKILGGLDLN